MSHKSHGVLTYRPDIDGLRAIAVLAVVVYHAWPKLLTGGYAGVDVFFVISGYLISSIILRDILKQHFSIKRFYEKRVKRIFPALILVFGAVLLAGVFLLSASEYEQLGKHILAGGLFVSNLVLWTESGYFDVASDLKPLLHLWSLGIEEQFYFIWPPLLLMGYYLKKIRLLLITFLVVSFVANIFFIKVHSSAVFYFPFTRFWELIAGGLLAYYEVFSPKTDKFSRYFLPDKKRSYLSVIGMIFILFSVIDFDHKDRFPGFLAVTPVLGSVLLIYAGPNALINKKVLSLPAVVWIGLISYPLYLWHWPLISFKHILLSQFTGDRIGELLIFICVVLSVILAWLTYEFVEKPMRFSERFSVKMLIIAMGLLVLLGGFVYITEGVPQRIKGGEAIQGTSEPFRESLTGKRYEECKEKYYPVDHCIVKDILSKPTVALIGDSHANHWYPVLSEFYKKNNENLILFSRNGTTPFYNVVSLRGKEVSNNDVLDYVLSNPSVHTVVLAGFWNNYFKESGVEVINYNYKNVILDLESKNKDSQNSIFKRGLERTIQLLMKNNKKIVFFYDIPVLPFYISKCVLRPFSEDLKSICSFPRKYFDKDNAGYKEVVAEILSNYPQVKTFDPSKFICDTLNCYPYLDGGFVYSDEHHLSIYGAQFFKDKLDFYWY